MEEIQERKVLVKVEQIVIEVVIGKVYLETMDSFTEILD